MHKRDGEREQEKGMDRESIRGMERESRRKGQKETEGEVIHLCLQMQKNISAALLWPHHQPL